MRHALAPVLVLVMAAPIAPAVAQEPARAAQQNVLVVGDSLAVGMRRYLGAAVDERPVRYSVKGGITTPAGMSRLRAQLREVVPTAVVISLGTNDGPDPFRFASRIDRVLELVPAQACIVWHAIHRSARKGAFRPMNRVLRAAARRDTRLTVVGWDRSVDQGSVVLADGIHPDADGYRRRGAQVASAVRRGCRAQDTGGVAPPA